MNNIHQLVQSKLYGKNIWEGVNLDLSKCDLQGWNGQHGLLTKFNTNFDHQIVIDLGVWKGQSTLTLANSLKKSNLNGTVIAIDTFLGSPEHHYETLYSRFPGGRPDLYEIFLANILNYGFESYVIPLVQTSIGAQYILKKAGIKATHIHIDAAHEYEEVKRDIQEYYQLLEVGGIMVCDDYIPGWPGVVKAVDEFCSEFNLELHVEFPKCCFIKK